MKQINPNGMVLLKKPEGVTSFQALSILKKKLQTKKVGHTGTLDKFATGLLVILIGKMTKFAPYITGMDKTYQATFRFGTSTTTLDPEGDFLDQRPIPSLDDIKSAINKHFNGEISQIPPDFSAVHINGKRAYQIKLAGDEVIIPPRKITINNFSIIDWNGEDLIVEISCSKGTYIRSIARDLGKLTNSLAYVVQLNRSEVGPFHVNNSVLGEKFNTSNLVDPYTLISNLGRQISYVTSVGQSEISLGRNFNNSFYAVNTKIFPSGDVALFTEEKNFVAMINIFKGKTKYHFVNSV